MTKSLWGVFAGVLTALSISGNVAGATPLKIGIFDSVGAKGLLATLQSDTGFAAETVKKLDMATLRRYDAIAIGAVRGGLPYKKWEEDLKVYVRVGGGAILFHDATGFRDWPASLFPTLFKGSAKLDNDEMVVSDNKHPVAAGLPARFKHAYLDHIQLDPGTMGKVLIKDAAGRAVVVAGELEKGRVVGNGMITGGAVSGIERSFAEKVAEGGERLLTLNALRWVAANRVSSLSDAELKQRESALALKQAAEVADDMSGGAAAPATGLELDTNMIFEQGFIVPSVAGIKNGGRFFLFDGGRLSIAYEQKGSRSLRSPEETAAIMLRLKRLGVTDIIFQAGGPITIRYPAYIQRLDEAAAKTGMDLWAFWHPNENSYKDLKAEAYMVKDKAGVACKYADILSPALMTRCGEILDQLAALNKSGRIKGVFLDEFWHPFVVDKLEDDIPKFTAFCRERYGLTPPKNIGEFFAKGLDWHDIKDPWWKRYILWKNTLIIDFVEKLTKTAHAKGFQVINQPYFTPGNGKGWYLGHGDFPGLARQGDFQWTYEPRFSDLLELYPYDKTIFGVHSHYGTGYSCVSMLRGNHGSYFIFQTMWLPLALGVNPRAVEMFERMVRNNRQWYGARPLTDAGVLTNGVEIELSSLTPNKDFMNYCWAPKKTLSSSQDAALTLVQDTEFYNRYKTLLAPPLSVSHLPEKTMEALKKYAENGGTLISLNADFSTSRDDHENTVDRTAELTGAGYLAPDTTRSFDHLRFEENSPQSLNVKTTIDRTVSPLAPNVQVLARFGDSGIPAITRVPLGKGFVIAFHFDVMRAINEKQPEIADYLRELVREVSAPPISVTGDLSVFKTLKKDNWVIVTILGKDINGIFSRKYPAKGTLRFDLNKLGLAGKTVSVISLTRNREIFPEQSLAKLSPDRWNAEQLKRGVPIYIPTDTLEKLEPPTDLDDEYFRKVTLGFWKKRAACRAYEREIIAIAPVGELFPGERAD